MNRLQINFKAFFLTGLFFLCAANPLFPETKSEMKAIRKILHSKVYIKAESGQIFNAGQEAAMDPKTGKIYVLTNLAGVKYERDGAGIILNSKGFIATNLHTVKDAGRITITFHENSQIEATPVQSYPDRDIAILRVKAPKPLEPIQFADSDKLKVGDQLYIIANSKLIRDVIGGVQIIGFDQTKKKNENEQTNIIQFVSDLPLQEGDSGSPILDKKGRFLGFVEAGHLFTQNPKYALPSNVIHNSYMEFLKSGKSKD